MDIDTAFSQAATREGLILLREEHGVARSLDDCPDIECLICGIIACPDNEPLHFHHDGCPACYLKEKDV